MSILLIGTGRSIVFTVMDGMLFEFWQGPETLLQTVQTGLGPSYIMGYRGFFRVGLKQPSHSPPSSAGVKNKWSCTPTPTIRLHDMYRENFTFFILLIRDNKLE